MRAKISPGVAIPWPAAPPIAIERSSFAIKIPSDCRADQSLRGCKTTRRHLVQDSIHFLSGKRAQCLSANVAQGPDACCKGHHALGIAGLGNQHCVHRTHGPVDVFDFYAEVRRRVDQRFGSFGGVADLANTLIGEIYERDVSGHRNLLLAPQNKKASSLSPKQARATGL